MGLLHIIKFGIECILSAIIVYPVLFTIFLPIAIYRQLIVLFVKIRDPKFGRILSGLDAIYIGKRPYSKPDVVLAPYVPLKTKFDRAQVVKIFNEQIIKSGEFPELSQRIVQKCGYNFYYQVDNVSAEHHVKYLNPKFPDKPVTNRELTQMTFETRWKQPFDSTRSPWEILLVPNFVDEDDPAIESMIMIRVNHCLMDGFSALNLMRKAAVKPWKNSEKSCQHEVTIYQKLVSKMYQNFLLMTTGPYHALKALFFSKDNSDFMKKVAKLRNSGLEQSERKSVTTRLISLKALGSLKVSHSVSMTGAILAIVMEAAVGLIKKKMGEQQPGERMYLAMPLPHPGHPGTLTNHFSGARIRIKVYEGDPVRTLKEINMEFNRVKCSIVPLVNFTITNLIGLLPAFLVSHAENIRIHRTIVLSSLAGPPEKADIFGYEYEQVCLTGGDRDIGPGFLFITMSCNGKLRFDITTMKMLLESDKDVVDFKDSILNILNTLQQVPSGTVL